MRVHRLYFPQQLSDQVSVEIAGESAHYLQRVLRLKGGDRLRLFNETNGEYAATVSEINRGSVLARIDYSVETCTDPIIHIHLGLGLSRGERMDYAIQKSTELGVSAITPLTTEHCTVKLSGDRLEKKLSHWRRIGISASEQCGRTRIPEVHGPRQILDWVSSPEQGNDIGYKVLLDHRGEDKILGETSIGDSGGCERVFLCIGPEGGFSDEEIGLARTSGFAVASMGPRVLRTETAPVSALSIIQYILGDF